MKLRKHILIILTVLCLPTSALATIDWSVNQTIETKVAIKDIATSFDGTSLLVLTKANELVMYDGAGKIEGSMPVDPGMDKIMISGFAKGGMPEQIFVSNSANGQIQKITFSRVVQLDITGSPFLGNAEAPVALVVFSDFQ